MTKEVYAIDERGLLVTRRKSKISKSVATRMEVPIVKADFHKRLIYLVIAEPGTVDAQGDVLDKEEIEKALHLYMAKHRKVGLDHERLLPKSYPVEAFQPPQDVTYEFNGHKNVVKAGSGVVAIYIGEDDVWDMVRRGECTGGSIKGSAVRESIEI